MRQCGRVPDGRPSSSPPKRAPRGDRPYRVVYRAPRVVVVVVFFLIPSTLSRPANERREDRGGSSLFRAWNRRSAPVFVSFPAPRSELVVDLRDSVQIRVDLGGDLHKVWQMVGSIDLSTGQWRRGGARPEEGLCVDEPRRRRGRRRRRGWWCGGVSKHDQHHLINMRHQIINSRPIRDFGYGRRYTAARWWWSHADSPGEMGCRLATRLALVISSWAIRFVCRIASVS